MDFPIIKNSLLWSTDFDGTLYRGSRRSATIPQNIIHIIAEWIRNGGYFHLLSSGSMAGMARDKFDITLMLLKELNNKPRHCIYDLLKERVLFSMSNGGENYRIVSPSKPILAGQVYLDTKIHAWMTLNKAVKFCQELKKYKISTLAIDQPLTDPCSKVSSIFIEQETDKSGKFITDKELINIANSYKLDIWVQFVREYSQNNKFIKRFDIYPLSNGNIINKGVIAKYLFPKFSHVIYTGDKPLGNDQMVFEYMNQNKNMNAYEVEHPDEIIHIINKYL